MDFPTSEATIFLLAREYTRSGHDLSLGVRYTHLINTVKTCVQKPVFFNAWQKRFLLREGRGGGRTPLYGLYRYVQPQRVWFFGCFGHKWGINLS